MSQWNNSESGILRKTRKKDNFEDLLVFGYACKIFRDDEKALHIDQGKHLIPWMGDERIKIDRYDCRGHLSDLSRFEASREGYDVMRWLGLDENERKLEQLCDQERYYSLHINEEEEEMYKEEEHKRNQANEFQYSYDVPMNPEAQDNIPTVPENDEDEKYVPSVDLDVPIDIAIPQTVRENARIEKTAMFVFTQGPQMEILIKAKQSDNPQFNFLNQSDPLYKFYRHVLNAIKTGRYQIKNAKTGHNVATTSGGDSGGHYLHPSLVSSSTSSMDLPLPTIPSVPYRPSANCAYSQLVSRIQGATSVGGNVPPPPQPPEPTNELQGDHAGQVSNQPNLGNLTYEQQQQYYQYYMQHQYYEYYKHMAQQSGVGDEITAHPETPMDPNMQAYIQQMMYAQYYHQTQSQQQQPTNPYAQIVSNVSKEIPNPYPPLEKPDIAKEPVIYTSNQESSLASSQQVASAPDDTPSKDSDSTRKVDGVKESAKKPSLLSLVQNYGSDSEEDSSEDEEEEDYNVPEGDTKVVIDKMACYVVKNGADFESIVKSRADPRFMFLNEDHEFHKYYQIQVNEERKKKQVLEADKGVGVESEEVPKVTVNKSKEKKIIAPVSFSIKKPKEEPPKEIKNALPVDEETDEEEENAVQEVTPVPPLISQPPTLVSSNASKIIPWNDTPPTISKEKEIITPIEKETPLSNPKDVKEIKENENLNVESEKNEAEDVKIVAEEEKELDVVDLRKAANRFKKNGALDKDDPILEMIDLTEDILDERNGDSKKDEDIFDLKSDKERPTKDNRALQLERRRKAMAFLKMKSATSSSVQVPDGAKTTIPIIDLSNVRSPRAKRNSSDSLDDEENIKPRKRSRSRSKEEELAEYKSKRTKESEKSVTRKEREKSRKCRSPRVDKKYDINNISDLEEGEMVDDKEDVKYKKSSHKKKKSHKRKRSKSKHSSKSKKKSKKKEPKSSSSDSDRSSHS